jgi:hypothetical protein
MTWRINVAGDWIKMRCGLAEEPEVIAMADSLGVDEDLIVGKLHRFWTWADSKTVDGNAPCVTKKWIDRYLKVDGIADALESVGWLVTTESGIAIPQFEAHMGQSAKRRALTAKRVANHKGKSNANGNAESVSEALPREEKRREDNKKKKVKKKKAGIPEGYTPEFEEFWEAYPRKVGKGNAWEVWPKALRFAASSSIRSPEEPVEEFLTRRARDYAAFTANQDREFIRHPKTWLNGGNWDDETGSRVATLEDLKAWRPE